MISVLKKYLSCFVKSCWDFKFYNKIINKRTADSVKYLFFLLFCISVITGLTESKALSRKFIDIFSWSQANLPVMNIQKGKLSIEDDLPFKTAYKNVPVIIDFNAADDYFTQQGKEGILIRKSGLIYSSKIAGQMKFGWSGIKELKIDEDFFKQAQKAVYLKTAFVIIILFYLYFILVKFAHIFLFSLFGMIVSKFKAKGLSFKQVFNLTAYAFSPAAIFSVIFFLMQVSDTTVSWLVYTAVFAFYEVSAVFYVMPCKSDDVL